MDKIKITDLTESMQLDLGWLSLTGEEIMEFAKMVDPLPFHIDIETARRSIFKGLIASGPHIFTKFYKEKFLPHFIYTIKAGLGVTNWKLLKPVYANARIHGSTTVYQMKVNPEKKHAIITWIFKFMNEQNEMVQSLEITILHWID